MATLGRDASGVLAAGAAAAPAGETRTAKDGAAAAGGAGAVVADGAPGAFDTQELSLLANELDSAEFFFKMLKDSYISRFQAERSDGAPSAGRGEVVPDEDRTEALDIRQLLLTQPRNTEAEKNFHKELFSKLKFNYLEQDAKEKFLRRVLDMTPQFATPESVQGLERQNAQQKESLKAQKASLEMLKTEVSDIAEHVCATYERVHVQKAEALQLQAEIAQLETKRDAVLAKPNPRAPFLANLEQKTSAQQDRIAALKSQIEAQRRELAEKQARRAQLLKQSARLEVRRQEAESNAIEAERISRTKDPQVESLGKWYQETIELLYKCSGIRHIKAVSDSKMEIVYEMDDGTPYTVAIRIEHDSEDNGNHVVKAQVISASVALNDIHDRAAGFPKLDHALSYTVRAVYTRLHNFHGRIKELHPHDGSNGIFHDKHNGDTSVYNHETGREFFLTIGMSYPKSRWQDIRFQRVDQGGREIEGEAEQWQAKLRDLKPQTFTELVPYLK
ncbi:hypothetical protein HK105_203356 [Polyrhizophydium stewartii]|uniref:Kinetochore protein Sos7 coiled-coil domain-containing protein n=1 Tax=Polyrhizophydium stewartii TaxID=2732419 RepID=A0ABR4NBW1_9FUNG